MGATEDRNDQDGFTEELVNWDLTGRTWRNTERKIRVGKDKNVNED